MADNDDPDEVKLPTVGFGNNPPGLNDLLGNTGNNNVTNTNNFGVDAFTGAAPSVNGTGTGTTTGTGGTAGTSNNVVLPGDQGGALTDLEGVGAMSSQADMLNQLYGLSVGARQAGVAKQEEAALAALGQMEQRSNRAMGQQQLQNERDIAKRRMMAVRSGMSPTNLAAQEMQNLMASQVGATQLAQQYDEQNFDLMTQFAGQQDMAAAYGMSDLATALGTDRSMDVQQQIGTGANEANQNLMQWLLDSGIMTKETLGQYFNPGT